MNIRGNCFTNLDNYQNEEWPRNFVALPRIGDRVRAKSGKSLKVCGLTHAEILNEMDVKVGCVSIELTKEVS